MLKSHSTLWAPTLCHMGKRHWGMLSVCNGVDRCTRTQKRPGVREQLEKPSAYGLLRGHLPALPEPALPVSLA